MKKIVDAFEVWDELAGTHRIYLVREVDGVPDDGTPMPSFARCSPEELALYKAMGTVGASWTGTDGLLGIPDKTSARRAASAIRKALS